MQKDRFGSARALARELAPRRRRVLARSLAVACAPDGQGLAVIAGSVLQFYALSPLRRMGVTSVAPAAPVRGPTQRRGSENVVKAAAWLVGGRLAVLVQHQTPPYARRISSRTLVIVDAKTHRVLRRPRVELRGAIVASGSAADRLVVLACRNNRTSLFTTDT
ncbi:MAG: hypothetical protein ABI317_02735, partial [Gaiellales bacterium]